MLSCPDIEASNCCWFPYQTIADTDAAVDSILANATMILTVAKTRVVSQSQFGVTSAVVALTLACPGIEVRVRDAPNLSATVVSVLQHGDLVEVLEVTPENPNFYPGFYKLLNGKVSNRLCFFGLLLAADTTTNPTQLVTGLHHAVNRRR